MRSKWKGIPLLLLFSGAAGCSIRLNDQASKPDSSVDTGSGCLTSLGDVIERFSAGTLTEKEHENFFSCAEKALTTFGEWTDGKNQDYFEPGELGGFLSKFFLNGKPIQPALMQEAMFLKAALTGGQTDRLSRQDLRNLTKVFGHFRELTGTLRTLMPVRYDAIRKKNMGQAEFVAMMRTFIEAMSLFGRRMQGQQSAYAFEHLGALARELRDFMYPGGAPADNWTNTVITMAKALPPAKVVLLAPPRSQISSEDWPRLYDHAARYYAAFLRVQYFAESPTSTMHGEGLRTIEGYFQDFMESFYSLLRDRPGQRISSEEIDDLLGTFAEHQLLPVRPETARQFVKALFGRFLGESDPLRFAITRDSLSHFQENVRFLLEGFRAAEALYRTKHGDHFLGSAMSREEIQAVSSELLLRSTLLGNALSREAVEALKTTPLEVKTVFGRNDFFVSVPKSGADTSFPYYHALKIHGLRAFNRLLIQGYGTPAQNRISAAQFDVFVNDMFPILVEAGLVDESMKQGISARLFEASLFLPASDGDKGLTMSEALELEAVLLSTLEAAPRVHQRLADLCRSTKLDDKGKPLIAGPCYREKFLDFGAETLAHVPGLADHLAALPPGQRIVLFDRLSRFLRKGQTIADDFSATDTQSYVLLPYYVEILFYRFDRNRDGKLVNAEGDIGFPIFQPFIAEKAAEKGFNNPRDHRAIYNFILAYRALPDEDKWAYVIRRYLLGPKKYSVDRGQMIEIFEKLLSL